MQQPAPTIWFIFQVWLKIQDMSAGSTAGDSTGADAEHANCSANAHIEVTRLTTWNEGKRVNFVLRLQLTSSHQALFWGGGAEREQLSKVSSFLETNFRWILSCFKDTPHSSKASCPREHPGTSSACDAHQFHTDPAFLRHLNLTSCSEDPPAPHHFLPARRKSPSH